jgi:hypothetical protein
MKRWFVAAPVLVLLTSIIGAGFSFGFRPAVAEGVRPLLQILAIVSCTSTSPCQTFANSSSGAGVKGTSSAGTGVVGQTTSNSNSRSPAGVLGQDLAASARTNFGVSGVSTNGTGVSGKSTSGEGVLGSSASSIGVEGTTAFASSGKTFGQAGVEGFDASTDGGNKDIGVLGQSANGTGMLGKSTTGVSVQGSSSKGVGVNAVGGSASLPFWPALSVVGAASGIDLLDACPASTINPCNPDGNAWVLRLDDSGNVTAKGSAFFAGHVGADCFVIGLGGCSSGNVNITGQYQVNGACVAGCAAATAMHPGRAVTRYVGTQTLPTVEDFGEAQLTNGQAYVPLDPSFANIIDQHTNYLVFITPEGPSRGLYITQKTLRGFSVRENPGGRSTIAFDYRIIAKPYAETQPRLPIATVPALRMPSRLSR